MKTNSSTILILVTVLVVAAGAYWYFSVNTGNESPLTVTTTTNDTQAQFQTLLGELQSIKFKTDIFSDPRFKALVDITVSVSPEPVGRTDPFAPVAGATAVSTPLPSASAVSPSAGTSAAPPASNTGGQ